MSNISSYCKETYSREQFPMPGLHLYHYIQSRIISRPNWTVEIRAYDAFSDLIRENDTNCEFGLKYDAC